MQYFLHQLRILSVLNDVYSLHSHHFQLYSAAINGSNRFSAFGEVCDRRFFLKSTNWGRIQHSFLMRYWWWKEWSFRERILLLPSYSSVKFGRSRSAGYQASFSNVTLAELELLEVFPVIQRVGRGMQMSLLARAISTTLTGTGDQIKGSSNCAY